MVRYFYAIKKKGEEKYLKKNVSRYGTTTTLSQSTVDCCIQTETISSAESILDYYVENHKTANKEDFEICKFKLEITKED